MPQVPSLSPEQAQASTAASAGMNPTNFLIAAADLHSQGQLSAPVPTGRALQTGKHPPRRPKIFK